MLHFLFMCLGPLIHFINTFTFIPKICKLIHKQTVTGGSRKRINNIDLTIRILLLHHLLRDLRRIIYA